MPLSLFNSGFKIHHWLEIGGLRDGEKGVSTVVVPFYNMLE